MSTTRSRRDRASIVVGSFALIAFIGFIDRMIPHVTFSPFYLVPIFLACWYVGRGAGIAAAVTCAVAGLAADVISTETTAPYLVANVALRLVLFVVMAVVFCRLRDLVRREREVAARERQAAARLQALADRQEDRMRSVIDDARAPLGDIYARIVSLGFDLQTMTPAETREVLGEVADASRRLSELVGTLQATAGETPVNEPLSNALS